MALTGLFIGMVLLIVAKVTASSIVALTEEVVATFPTLSVITALKV